MAAAREGVAGSELLFLFGDGKPGGEGTGLFNSVAFFAAIVFAIGEGIIFGRDAVGEFKVAVGLLGRMDGAPGFLEKFRVGGRHLSNRFAAADADHDFLDQRGAIEALAGFLPLFAFELIESDCRAGHGELRLGLLLPGALQGSEILEDAFERVLGSGLVAVEESQLVEGFRRPILGIGLRGVEGGFDGIEGALPAPEKPAGEGGVFDQVARVRGFGGILFQ